VIFNDEDTIKVIERAIELRNARELAKKIRLVLDDRGIARGISQKAYEKVLEGCTWKKVLSQYLSLYAALRESKSA